MILRSTISFLIAVLVFSHGFSATVSICQSTPTVAQALKNADVVFAGRVVAQLKYGVRFKVKRSWKGDGRRFIYVYTGNMRSDAIPKFIQGEEWLVYASKVHLYRTGSSNISGTRLMAHSCNRTVLLENAEEDLQKLDKTAAPRK